MPKLRILEVRLTSSSKGQEMTPAFRCPEPGRRSAGARSASHLHGERKSSSLLPRFGLEETRCRTWATRQHERRSTRPGGDVDE
jgi:hypothetical protein